MRGKQQVMRCLALLLRITPAHAGKTALKQVAKIMLKDHPRACGENEDNFRGFNYRLGSPPRMRGKHWDKAWHGLKERITPAHAGKTPHSLLSAHAMRDHPRACGENGRRGQYLRGQIGSPPRMRGKRRSSGASHSGAGITPAHAGKTEGA